MHEPNLTFNYLLSVFGMFHWLSLQIQVLGIDRFLLKQLVKFSAQVFQPVVPLRPCPVVAQGFDIDDSSDIG